MFAFLKRHSLLLASAGFLILSAQIASSNAKGIGGSVIIGRAVTIVTAPVMSAFNYTIDTAKGMWNGYVYLINLKEENEILKGAIAKLKEENNALKEGMLTNKRISSLISMADTMLVKSLISNVIGINNSGWLRTATIDKGAEHGITKDMTVLTSDGIAGRVIEAYPNASNVLLLIDPRSNIDVVIQRTRIKGIAEGRGDNRLVLKYVQEFEDVRLGDVILSAGIGGVFPKGIQVGEVVKVEKSDDSFFKSIEIKTSVDFKRLEEVLVLNRF